MEFGVAIGVRIVGLLRKLAGVHETVPVVVANKETDSPTQILVSGDIDSGLSKT